MQHRSHFVSDDEFESGTEEIAAKADMLSDAFPDDAGRDAHLTGKVARALMEKAPELLAEPPKIEKADVLADRLLG